MLDAHPRPPLVADLSYCPSFHEHHQVLPLKLADAVPVKLVDGHPEAPRGAALTQRERKGARRAYQEGALTQLDANVVLHHAEVGEDEIRWLGPVPYTAPLRTLRDCIASHLSPDLIEQAVAEGLQRGMFTEAELPPDVHRGAA